MFSTEFAKKLLLLPKVVRDGTTAVNLLAEKSRYILVSKEESEYEFLFEITSHKKISLKVSLHHQENNSREGLLRVDYKGGHKNPENVTDFVPEIVKPYVGYFFQNEPHIHVFVEGFRNLAWAIPLSEYAFSVLDIQNTADYGNAVQAFAKEINIVSPLTIQHVLL
ncbi:MAG: hypothetical protein INR69_15290 [Mucilaginibacter polytrichastri]|nr:hypothetical protein [Mucilaginibacter polytrichastri]